MFEVVAAELRFCSSITAGYRSQLSVPLRVKVEDKALVMMDFQRVGIMETADLELSNFSQRS